MKLNMILGKKQIILASLILILSIAVYLNWQFASQGKDFAISGALNDTQNTTSKNLGDAQLVNNSNAEDYFTKARLERQTARDKSIEAVTLMLKDVNLSEEEKEKTTAQANEITKNIDAESRIENLIKAKGFEQCMVYLDGVKANVVVQTEGLNSEQAAQIKEIVISQTSLKAENLSITEVK